MHEKSWEGMEWMDVSKMVAFSRNCIVHNEGRVTAARWKKLNKQQALFVKSMMKKTILSEEERTLPDARTMDHLIEALTSFGYGLYVLVSRRCELAVEYDPFKKVLS